ncbi:MAG TPA: Ig-like domain-containing protein, partial [bacterium]|nr:Ig-like domain-containing protein [bacterium]
NALDQLIITVSVIEELDGAPVVTLDEAPLDDPTPEGNSWIYAPALTHGDHTIKATATDTAGNTTAAPIVKTYSVDAQYPTATVSEPDPDRISGSGKASVTVTGGAGETLVHVKLNGNDCAGTGPYTCDFDAPAGSGDTTETLVVSFSDEAGNTTTVTKTVTVDRTAPVLTFKKNKDGIYNKNDIGQILLSISSTEELSELTVNGTTQNDPTGLSWDITPDTSTNTHTIIATAKDKAGNPTAVALEESYTIDATDPTATIGALSATRVKENTEVTFTVTKAGEEDLASVTVRDSDGTLKDCPDGDCAYTTAVGTVGTDTTETVTVQYTDAAGNTVIVPAGTVHVDRTAPVLTFKKNKNTIYNKNDIGQILLSISSTEELSELTINGNTQADPAGLSWDIPPDTSDGPHPVTATAKDKAGNPTAAALEDGYAVDMTDPEATIGALSATRVQGNTTVTFTVTKAGEEDLASVMVRDSDGTLKDCPDGDCAYTTAVGTVGTDTTETVTVQYADAAGNTVTANAGTVYVDRTAPRMVGTLISPKEARKDALVQVVVTFDEPVSGANFGGDGLAFTRTDDGSDPQRYTYEYPVAGTETKESYALTLAAVDAANNPVADTGIGILTIDLLAPTVNDLLVCHDDTTDDPCAVDETLFSAVTDHREMKISFSLSEAADTLSVRLGTTELTATNCTAFAGPSYICTATVMDAAAGTDPRMAGDLATVSTGDDAGNSDFDSKSVVYDFLPPSVAGDATIVLTRPDDCPLLSDELARVTYGTTVRAQFSVSEELDGDEPVSVIAQKDTQTFPLDPDANAGYSFTYLMTMPLSGTFPQGDYVLAVTLRDTVGNEAELSPTLTAPGIYLDTAAPADPDVATADRIVYRRIPWGSDATGGVKSFSISAGTDAVDATTAFVIAFDGDDPATDAQIGIGPVTNRSFADMELNRADRAEVYLAAYDTACNRSDTVRVRDVEWTATMGYKVAGSTFENPNRYKKQKWFTDTLDQYGAVE